MKDEFERKLQSIKNIVPSAANEAIIRNLCHSLLNEAKYQDINNSFSLNLEKECYKVLDRLEREKIMSLSSEKFMPFYKYDFPLLIKNAVCASDIFLSSPKHVFINAPYSPFYAVCSEKLITRAVFEEAKYFYSKYKYATVKFSAEKKRFCFLLSVKATVNNQQYKINEEKTFSIMRKTAYIHGGTFLVKKSHRKEEHYLSIGNCFENETKYRRIPSYIDMLSDKMSSVYIILGSSI